MGFSVDDTVEPTMVSVGGFALGPLTPSCVNSSCSAPSVHVDSGRGGRHRRKLSCSGVTVGLGVTGRWVIPPTPMSIEQSPAKRTLPVTPPRRVTPQRYAPRCQLNGWGW